ncbi:CPCC family cysteine-rich protein [Pseudomonas syringae]|uniref:CPCC family cysteine-rich protein n=1 Tax=Pseudomonas syringae TaxID=317 RepID=UPI0013736BD9|nr:CPCC family cysteine-rich protein [Pseudomonas syringae]NAT23927.1 hypothetical protein [Pseudomonas syringae pv. actinidifoliorum]NAT38199.1 hypothetical protein [Pseudomonas syringae pv. actinidifoliorum]
MRDLPCPCCGFVTLTWEYGSYDICPLCSWEDDAVQLANATSEGGANSISLADAQMSLLNKYPITVRLAGGFRRALGWRPLEANDLEAMNALKTFKHWHTIAVRWESEAYWSMTGTCDVKI